MHTRHTYLFDIDQHERNGSKSMKAPKNGTRTLPKTQNITNERVNFQYGREQHFIDARSIFFFVYVCCKRFMCYACT